MSRRKARADRRPSCTSRTNPGPMAAAARARVEKQFAFGRMVEAYRAIIAPAATGGGDRLSMAAT